MTAEVIVLTPDAVVIATDSAVTINNKKVFTGVQKIFSIDEDIGMAFLVYNNSKFAGRSINALIEDFKCNHPFKGQYSVKNIMNNFIDFCQNYDFDEDGHDYIIHQLNLFKKFKLNEFNEIGEENFQDFIDYLPKKEICPFLDKFNIDFFDIIPNFVTNPNEINRLLLEIFSQFLEDSSTGVVIAGFDMGYNHPSYVHFKLIVNISGNIEYELIGFEENIHKTRILSFADDDEIKMFLEGIHPDLDELNCEYIKNFLDDYLLNLIEFFENYADFNQDVIDKLKKEYLNFKELSIFYSNNYFEMLNDFKNNRKQSISSVCESLPIGDLIDFAEFLIIFVSSKRKYSMDLENVGGDVNSVLLTKK